jgi:hypothetical protein
MGWLSGWTFWNRRVSRRGSRYIDNDFGVVHIKGTVRGPLGDGALAGLIFTLPEGYRPTKSTCFSSQAIEEDAGDLPALVCVDSTGLVRVDDGHGGLATVFLDGITFRAGTG